MSTNFGSMDLTISLLRASELVEHWKLTRRNLNSCKPWKLYRVFNLVFFLNSVRSSSQVMIKWVNISRVVISLRYYENHNRRFVILSGVFIPEKKQGYNKTPKRKQ